MNRGAIVQIPVHHGEQWLVCVNVAVAAEAERDYTINVAAVASRAATVGGGDVSVREEKVEAFDDEVTNGDRIAMATCQA